jgi:cytochrome c553
MSTGRSTPGARRLALRALAAGAAIVGGWSGAVAQSAPPADLRPLYANSADIADGKRLADSTCAVCHGANGVSTAVGVPNLAGQRAPYLYTEMKAYQSSARPASAVMRNTVLVLNDEALIRVAAYYASLDPAPSSPGNAATLDPVKAGEAAAANCAGCHGERGISKTPGFPSLVGLDPKYLVAVMKAYRSGQRKNPLMKSMVENLADAAIANVALYYALQKPAPAQSAAGGDRAAGQTAATPCAGCHGDTGVSGNPDIPSIAGQDATYIAAALAAYRQGERNDETMKGMVAALDAATIKNLAAYYAAQEPKPPANVRRPLTVEEWAERCDRCHGVNGNSIDARLPALAAQRPDYLEKALRDYQMGVRKSAPMAAMSEALSEGDVKNLAAYYASQKARAVMFIAIPSK